MRQLTFKDVTKDELITYFFDALNGHGGLPANKERFFAWVQNRRTGLTLRTLDACIEESQKAFNEYIENVQEANKTKDLDKKMEFFGKANEAWERYQRAEKNYNKLNEEIDKNLEIGKYRREK